MFGVRSETAVESFADVSAAAFSSGISTWPLGPVVLSVSHVVTSENVAVTVNAPLPWVIVMLLSDGVDFVVPNSPAPTVPPRETLPANVSVGAIVSRLLIVVDEAP